MSKSFKFDPEHPHRAYNGKVRYNSRRRTRQGVNHQRNNRTMEFNIGVNSSGHAPNDFYDEYGDYDYSRSRYAYQ
jgi:hypothetical protein